MPRESQELTRGRRGANSTPTTAAPAEATVVPVASANKTQLINPTPPPFALFMLEPSHAMMSKSACRPASTTRGRAMRIAIRTGVKELRTVFREGGKGLTMGLPANEGKPAAWSSHATAAIDCTLSAQYCQGKEI